MNNSIKKLVAASFIMLGAIQADAASIVSGTIQVTRDSSRTINGAIIVTEKRDAAGKPIALTLVMDENGKAIAQQYENKQIKIEGNVQGKNLTADTWKEIKDNSFSNSFVPDPEPSRDEEESYEEDEENSDEEEDSEKPKKHKKSRKVANPKSDDEENEDSDSDSDSDSNSDDEDSDSDSEKDSDDNSDNNSDDEENQDEDNSNEDEE